MKNKLGITDPIEMDKAEALIKATGALFHEKIIERSIQVLSK
ncbi:hypothetical protein [Sulfuriflexus sp.]|nr:hypothetical protein [Sulfuriflexus sp.]MDT8403009.1 hypothetical protein [Sulfuriflexus sp.]